MTDPLLQLTLTLFFSVLFALAAWHKWQDIHHTATTVAKYRLLPVDWSYPAAYIVAGFETLVVFLIWFMPKMGVILIIALLTFYLIAIGINLKRGRLSMDCGCGGVPIRLTPLLLARNAVLIVFASLLLLAPSERIMVWTEGLVSILFALTLLALYYAGEQLLSNRGQRLLMFN